jgi:hypothetical protein
MPAAHYAHPTSADNYNEWRADGDFWWEALFERDAYAI